MKYNFNVDGFHLSIQQKYGFKSPIQEYNSLTKVAFAA